jgi:hypothetical protein
VISVEMMAEADDLAERVTNFWTTIVHHYMNGVIHYATTDEDVGIPLCYMGYLKEERPKGKFFRYELTPRGRVKCFEHIMKARR